jgi:hypothetical protein
MSADRAERLYELQVKALSPNERLRLLALLARDLAASTLVPTETSPGRSSILDLHELGRQIWEGVAVESYVSELRDEWAKPA